MMEVSPEDCASAKHVMIDPAIEYAAFDKWHRWWLPGKPIPTASSHMFDTWLASTRHRTEALSGSRGEGETWASINQWCDETFGPATVSRIISRAKEEFDELIDATDSVEHAAIEAADVTIILCRIPGFAEALQKKMAINRARKWNTLGDGTGYHISEAPTPPTVPAKGDSHGE